MSLTTFKHNIIVVKSVDIWSSQGYRPSYEEYDLMGVPEYSKALSVAERELSKLTTEADAIARRRAQLQQTIATLKTLTNVSRDGERTLTDVIRIIVKAANGYISAAAVLQSAYSMGAKFSGKNPKASIITILGRLVRDGELERERGTIKVRFRSKTGAPA